VATPPEFPKGHPGIWSPEHLFVAAAEVCLMTTFLAIAENSKLDFSAYSSEAVGTLEKTENGFLMTKIVITPRIAISDEAKRDRALRIIDKAEKYCLISNSMHTDVSIEPVIEAG
jgi:peroxiredoxin-like protein